jgi:hypothetical protein
MLRKALAAGLLVALCLGFLAVEGVSQAPPPVGPAPSEATNPWRGPQPPAFGSSVLPPQQAEPSFAELVQQLKNVRAQQEALKQQEKQLLDQIARKVDEQRRELQQAEQLLQQLQPPGEKTGPQQRPPLNEKTGRDKGPPDSYRNTEKK